MDLATQHDSELDWGWADIVMIWGVSYQRNNLLGTLVREGKERGKTIVVGGPYPSSSPDEPIAAGCDFLVKGEAENTISFC